MKNVYVNGLAQQLPYITGMILIFVLSSTAQIHSAAVYLLLYVAFCTMTVLWSRLCIHAFSERHKLSPVASALYLMCQVCGLCLLTAAVMYAHFQETERSSSKPTARAGVNLPRLNARMTPTQFCRTSLLVGGNTNTLN